MVAVTGFAVFESGEEGAADPSGTGGFTAPRPEQ
jgi:hypothetical protein